MPKVTLTADEFYTWIKDCAENGSTRKGYIDSDGYMVATSEQEDAEWILYNILNEEGFLEDQVWHFNATYEQMLERDYWEDRYI